MGRLEIKRDKGRYRVNLFHSDYPRPPREKAHYTNVIDRDPKKLAQILIDLYFEGFPIEKAYQSFSEKVKKKDWLGLD